MKRLRVAWGVFALALGAAGATTQVTTSQYDNLRTGATLIEKTLNPQNVNAQQFGKLGAFEADGAIYAQPLFLPSVEIPGKGRRNVLFVATEHDSVYAFDAERPNDPPLWHVSLLDKKRGEETSPLPSPASSPLLLCSSSHFLEKVAQAA